MTQIGVRGKGVDMSPPLRPSTARAHPVLGLLLLAAVLTGCREPSSPKKGAAKTAAEKVEPTGSSTRPDSAATAAPETEGETRPVVAVALAVDTGGEPGWLGFLVADHVVRRLLVSGPIDPESKRRAQPVEVFSWRQTMSAARMAGISSAEIGARADEILRELGANHLFTSRYTVADDRVVLRWQLADGSNSPTRELSFPVDEASSSAYGLGTSILEALGQKSAAEEGALEPLAVEAAPRWGRALAVLSRQSQDPRSNVVLERAARKEAIADLKAVTEAAPRFAPAWAALAVATVVDGDWEITDAALDKARTLALPGDPAAALATYYVAEQQTRRDEARAALERAVETYPGSLQVIGYLGDAYYGGAEYEKALRVFTTYLERVPESPYAQKRRDVVLARLGQIKQALKNAKALVAEHPESMPILAALASRQIDAGQLADARQTLEAGLVDHPNHPLLLTRLSFVELEGGDPKRALELAEKSVALLGKGRGEPLAGYAHIDLARALAVAGRREEAKKSLIEAVRLGVDADDLTRLAEDPRLEGFIEFPIVLPAETDE